MNKLFLTALLLSLGACVSVMEISEIDLKTGYFPAKATADITKKDKYDIDSMKSLLLVTSGPFVEGQVRNMKYFDKIISSDDLATIVVREKLQTKVNSNIDRIFFNQAYENYKPFLWLRYKERNEGKDVYAQFILTEPKDMTDLFIAEKRLDRFKGINDQTIWYPLCNALLDYIRDNSTTYK